MRYQSIFVSLVCILAAMVLMPGMAFAQQDAPEQIQSALDDLSLRTGTEVSLDNVEFYTFEGQQFSDTSLGCPAEGQTYAQVVTPGYQFTITYDGLMYDYRVSQDQNMTILCSIDPASGNEQLPISEPEPRHINMEQPAVAIAPLGGAAGTSVEVIANGFPRSTFVLIGIGQAGSEYEVLQTQQTTTRGVLATTITIPNYFTGNEEVVIIVETDDNSLRVVSPAFTVNSSDVNTGNPSVILEPQSGVPGSDVQLTATGYPPNTSVIVGVGLQDTEGFNYSLRETTDAQGNLVTTIAIPEDALVNRPYIALVQVEADRDYEAISSAFIPTGTEPTPIPDGSEFTSSDMYLIAPGDNGQSGVPIGCDDSAIPVQVTFDPTVTPLTATLQELLALDTRTYGQSGLYNALYQSDLSIEGINIIDGVATINLTGNLQLDGVCDTPRIEAQITQTALQFATIDSVNILINGQPIADVIGDQ